MAIAGLEMTHVAFPIIRFQLSAILANWASTCFKSDRLEVTKAGFTPARLRDDIATPQPRPSVSVFLMDADRKAIYENKAAETLAPELTSVSPKTPFFCQQAT